MAPTIQLRDSVSHGHFFIPWLSLLTFAVLISGCQTFSINQDAELSVSTGKTDTVETHQFAITQQQAMVGMLTNVESHKDDALPDLARHFGLGFTDITLANPDLDPWVLPENQAVLLPLQFILPEAPRKGLVLNLANMRLFYYPTKENTVQTYPVGIGRDGWNTPLGVTEIVAKKANPAWTVPESIQREHEMLGDTLPAVIPSGPDNPLGYFAMPLGFSGYLIHGTNKPYGIGMQVSHGCVQLYPEDVEVLFNQVKVGIPVNIVHQPYLAAWEQDMLFLEAHQPLEKWAKQTKQMQKKLRVKLTQLAAEKNQPIDWPRVEAVLKRADGIPTPVLEKSPDMATLKADAIKVQRPAQLFGQPNVNDLSISDWSAVVTDSFANETEAQKLTAMLNHQGPQIPARKVQQDGAYRVVAGPFKNRKETKLAAKRIKNSFDLEVIPVQPQRLQN